LAALALMVLAVLGAAARPAVDPPTDSVLKIPVPGARQKPPVFFSHRRHEAGGIACARCHHEYQGRRNVWRQGQPVKPCADCHGPRPQRRAPDLKNAMHLQCKGCHLKLRQQQRRAGPVHCRECHGRT
jgi:hypothetical protein